MMKLMLSAVCALLVLLATAGTAVATGVPLESGGVVLVSPQGNGPDGKTLSVFPAGTLTLGVALCAEPEALTAKTFPQFILANTRLELLGYSERVLVDTPTGPTLENDMKTTFGVSLNILAEGLPTKAGLMYYPNSEWHTARYIGLDLFLLMPDPVIPGLSLTPQYTSEGLTWSGCYEWEFE